jgi:hypothetical protein
MFNVPIGKACSATADQAMRASSKWWSAVPVRSLEPADMRPASDADKRDKTLGDRFGECAALKGRRAMSAVP